MHRINFGCYSVLFVCTKFHTSYSLQIQSLQPKSTITTALDTHKKSFMLTIQDETKQSQQDKHCALMKPLAKEQIPKPR